MSANVPMAAGDAPLPATYEAAQRALAECSRIDECKGWADKAQALASYARQAKDTTMHSMALRIQNRAMRRAGELLKLIQRADEATRYGQEGAHPPVTRTQVATDAGLSEHQRKTALRVASVPAADFERAVESHAPPTVTQMATLGTVPRHLQPSAPPAGDHVGASSASRLLRELSGFCGTHDPVAVAAAAQDSDLMRGFVESIDRWLDRFVTHLPASDDEAA
jgi:CRP-like cAMP-binding protein